MNQDDRPADPWEAPPHEHEEQLRAEFQQLPGRALVDVSCSALAVAIERASSRRAEDEATALRETAALAAGIRAFRMIRAGLAAVASGYELEADAAIRVVLELFVGVKPALADPTGEEARRWLTRGQRSRVGQRIDATGGEDAYASLSRVAHGDPRAVLRLSVETKEGAAIEWGPGRTTRTPRILNHYAIGARDFAVLISETFKLAVPELDHADRVLAAAVPEWKPDAAWEGS